MAVADTSDGNSGLARAFRSSGLARPTAAKRAFQPLRTNAAPALGIRFASDAREGKIHQVIGAVVDGPWKSLKKTKPAVHALRSSIAP